MVALCERLSAMTCVTMKVREWNDSIVFLHEVTPGAADRSYGIHVAKLAGLLAVVALWMQAMLALAGRMPLLRVLPASTLRQHRRMGMLTALLVLAGGFTEGGEAFTAQSWLRLPAGTALQAHAGPAGCRLWVKEGHLAEGKQRWHEAASPC